MKRIIAFLVSICVMLTTGITAFALDPYDSVPLTLEISSLGAPFYNPNTKEHDISRITWTHYINREDVGADYAHDCTAEAYFIEEGGAYWLCLTLDIGDYHETFEKVSNARVMNMDMSSATGDVDFGLSFNTSGGVKTSIYISGGAAFPDPEVTYTLTYDANEGINAPAQQTAATTESSYTFTVSEQAPEREGYTFLGWADSANAVEAQYQAGSTVTLTKDAPAKTIYAVWEQNDPEPEPEEEYTVSFEFVNAPEGAELPGSITKPAGTTVFLPGVNAPVGNWHFDGWYEDSGCTGEKLSSYTITGNATLYGKWYEVETPEEEACILTFEYAGEVPEGVKVPAARSYPKDTTTGLPYPSSIPEGYAFDGWYTDENCTVKAAIPYLVSSDATLYGKWTKGGEPVPTTYTVTYTDGVEGEEVFADQVYTGLSEGVDTPAFEGTPTREGLHLCRLEP